MLDFSSFNILVTIGPIGSGKDFTCKNLIQNYGFKRLDFKTALMESVWLLLNWRPENDGIYERFKLSKIENKELGISITGREVLENFGTECIREYLNLPTLWIDKLMETIKNQKDVKVCIGDCRFLNEVKALLTFSDENKLKVGYVITDFKSKRYDNSGTHKSRKLAQNLLKLGYKDQQVIDSDEMKKLIQIIERDL